MIRCFAVIPLALCLFLGLAACGGSDKADGKIDVPASSRDFEGKDYKDVVGDFKSVGFTNVETKAIRDLITGWLTKDGEVEKVTIGKLSTFDAEQRFAKDAKVVVWFHTFPEPSPKPEESHERSKPNTKPDDTVLTVLNNPDLAALLALGDNCADSVATFARKYEGRTISFDGNIADMAPHGSYATRFDFLIYPGDYSEVTARGPSFQFRDKNVVHDLHLTGDNIPDTIGRGQNLHVTAELGEYNPETCLYQLTPVETRIR